MSEAAAVLDLKGKASNKPEPMLVRIVGRVESIRRYDGFTYTVVITPAPDVYSKPNYVEFRSKGKFADKEDEVDVRGRLGGWLGKQYQVKDKTTGEVSTLTPCNMFLDYVE